MKKSLCLIIQLALFLVSILSGCINSNDNDRRNKNKTSSNKTIRNNMIRDYVSILEETQFSKLPAKQHRSIDHFITAYARKSAKEDFAEMGAHYTESTINLWLKAINHWREVNCTIFLEKTCFLETVFVEDTLLYLYTSNAAIRLPLGLDREVFRKTAYMLSQGMSKEIIEKTLENDYARHIFKIKEKHRKDK